MTRCAYRVGNWTRSIWRKCGGSITLSFPPGNAASNHNLDSPKAVDIVIGPTQFSDSSKDREDKTTLVLVPFTPVHSAHRISQVNRFSPAESENHRLTEFYESLRIKGLTWIPVSPSVPSTRGSECSSTLIHSEALSLGKVIFK